jgi:hypothetical protein
MHWLRETLVENHKVLEALVDYVERLHDNPPDQFGAQARNPNFITEVIDDARGMCWEIWRDTYKQAAGFRPSEFKDRELLRHSRRLLNFAYRYIQDTLAKSEKQYYDRDKRQSAEAAIKICESFISSLAPTDGPRHYRHPEASKWLRLQAQCKRRMSELWLTSARKDESEAKSRSTVIKLPIEITNGTWEQIEKLGFRLVSLCDDQVHREVYLPVAWTIEYSADAKSGRIVDRYNRLRAEVNFSPEAPTMQFVHRYRMVEVTEDGLRCFRIIDNAERGSTITESRKRPLAEDGEYDRKYAQGRCDSLNSNGYGPFDFAR